MLPYYLNFFKPVNKFVKEGKEDESCQDENKSSHMPVVFIC